jgi:hypothetical protein
MEIVPGVAMSVTVPARAGGIIPVVRVLLLPAVVRVRGLLIIARLVLILMARAGMLRAAVIPVVIPRMLPGLIAGEFVSPAMAQVLV